MDNRPSSSNVSYHHSTQATTKEPLYPSLDAENLDLYISRIAPYQGNSGSVVQVDSSHPPNFTQFLSSRNFSLPPDGAQYVKNPELQVELCDKNLWDKFSQVGTEMIVTRTGRRMFPGYRIKLSGLNPDQNYCVLMDIVNVDDHRYKFQQGEWMVAGKGEPHGPQRLFLHLDSPASGRKWMEDIISFYKLKLTNRNTSSSTEKIALNSMHRYQPRVHVVQTDDVNTLQLQPMSTFSFPQTVFITVTAYQNSKVTKLKIDNNPFAKGFRDNGGRSSSKNKSPPQAKRTEDKSYFHPGQSRQNGQSSSSENLRLGQVKSRGIAKPNNDSFRCDLTLNEKDNTCTTLADPCLNWPHIQPKSTCNGGIMPGFQMPSFQLNTSIFHPPDTGVEHNFNTSDFRSRRHFYSHNSTMSCLSASHKGFTELPTRATCPTHYSYNLIPSIPANYPGYINEVYYVSQTQLPSFVSNTAKTTLTNLNPERFGFPSLPS
ncbi:unnamed protein product [Clavelina lepadiformis]|uniref:T-box domain-containing protein n=1 Tax=Clavelina lepadiformis TaxID=159417 RepID=A0ABP0FKQ7_CLALP